MRNAGGKGRFVVGETPRKHWMEALLYCTLAMIVILDVITPSTACSDGRIPSDPMVTPLMVHITPNASPLQEKFAFFPSNTVVDTGPLTVEVKETMS